MSKNSTEKTPYLAIELLESFTNKEINGLQKIHKTSINQVIQVRMYNLVFSDQAPAKNKLSKKQKAILHAKISLLTRLAEKFITIEALEQFNTSKYELKLSALLKRKQYRLFDKHLKKGETLCGDKLEKMDDFEFKFVLEHNKLHYIFQTGQWLNEDNLNELIETLDLNYLFNRMNFTRTALAFLKRKPKGSYNFLRTSLIDTKVFKKYFGGNYPLLMLKMMSIQLDLLESKEIYSRFIDLLEEYGNLMLPGELRGYYSIAINFCNRMIRKGQINYANTYVEVLKLMDKKDIFVIDNSISHLKLKNLVVIGCKANQFSWVLSMIEKYVPYLNSKYSIQVEKFNLGYVAHQQKNYKLAINYLLEIDNFQESYDIDKRILILKSYYELEKHYSEPTAQLFRSIEGFVLNSKQYTEVDKKMYKNTIRIFYNLYRYKHKVGKMTLDKLQQQIEQAEYIASKAWLLEKIEELR